jgi:hypothetical protein
LHIANHNNRNNITLANIGLHRNKINIYHHSSGVVKLIDTRIHNTLQKAQMPQRMDNIKEYVSKKIGLMSKQCDGLY